LRRQHDAVDSEKQADRSAKELEILGVLPIAAWTILTRDADRAVKLLADGEAARAVGLFEIGRKDLVFAAFAFGNSPLRGPSSALSASTRAPAMA
jgi:hypothetical protein